MEFNNEIIYQGREDDDVDLINHCEVEGLAKLWVSQNAWPWKFLCSFGQYYYQCLASLGGNVRNYDQTRIIILIIKIDASVWTTNLIWQVDVIYIFYSTTKRRQSVEVGQVVLVICILLALGWHDRPLEHRKCCTIKFKLLVNYRYCCNEGQDCVHKTCQNRMD